MALRLLTLVLASSLSQCLSVRLRVKSARYHNKLGGGLPEAIQRALAVADPQENCERAREAFIELRRTILQGKQDVAALDEQASSAEPVLHFLLDTYACSKKHRAQIEVDVVKNLKSSELWMKAANFKPVREHLLEVLIACGVEGPESLGQLSGRKSQLPEFLAVFGLSLETMSADVIDEVEILEVADDEELLPVVDPEQQKMEAVMSEVAQAAQDRRIFANNCEASFQDLRRTLLHLHRKEEKMVSLLDDIVEQAPSTWAFIIRMSDRRFYQAQLAEVTGWLILSVGWKAALVEHSMIKEALGKMPPKMKEVLMTVPELSKMAQPPPVRGASKVDPGPNAEAEPFHGDRAVRLLLARADHNCLTAELLQAMSLTRGLFMHQLRSWKGCGIGEVDWVGAAPYGDALKAAERGFLWSTVQEVPYLSSHERRASLGFFTGFHLEESTVVQTPEEVLLANMSRPESKNYRLGDIIRDDDEQASAIRDWALFEKFLSQKVLPALPAKEVSTLALSLPDDLLFETFGKRGFWWNSYRSSLCRDALTKPTDGPRPEVLEVWYEYVNGVLSVSSKGVDGGKNCRVVADCSCFKAF